VNSKISRSDERIRLSIILPIFAFVLSATAFLISAFQGYRALRAAPVKGSMIVLSNGRNTFEIPREGAMRAAWFMAGLAVEWKIVALNMPGHFFQLLIAVLLGKSAHWFPESLGPALWRVIAFPIFAAPGWWFVGNGLDNLVRMRKGRTTGIVASIVLAVLFAALALMLRFGLTESERNDQEMLSSYILGLALWVFLFAIPAFAWIRWKVRSSTVQTNASAD
jgi:hypothetical protein